MKIPFRRIFNRRIFRSGTCKKRGRQEPSFPAQRFKKASQSLPPAGGKGILIIFCRGVYLTENTTQAASVRLVRCKRTRRARSRLQSFCQKRAKPFFDSLNLIGVDFFVSLGQCGRPSCLPVSCGFCKPAECPIPVRIGPYPPSPQGTPEWRCRTVSRRRWP